jgi:hypothetical protein
MEKKKKKMDTVKLSEYLNAYKFNTVLPGSQKLVNFKPISTFQLKELASSGGEPDDALDNLINSCVIDELFDVKEIPLQDRFFLLVELRKKSKGSKYNISFECGECKSQVLQVIDLDEMVTKELDKDLDYTIKLDDNITIGVNLLSRNTLKKASSIVEKLIKDKVYKEDDKIMDESIMSYVLSINKIITPAGDIENPDMETSMMLFKSPCPMSFYDRITEWYEKLDFGIDFKFNIECTHCQNKEEIQVTLENFFS